MTLPVALPTRADYRRVFSDEQTRGYPAIEAFEARCGYAVDRHKLETAARVLACPIKAHPPNWQHGRVLYAATRQYLEAHAHEEVHVLDIGTAKGFSALCLRWALDDARAAGRTPGHDRVTSVDVIDPHARLRRNTIAECDAPITLADTLVPWPEAQQIEFVHATGLDWLLARQSRVHVAFVDGKHTDSVVYQEGRILSTRQQKGDLAIVDDLQIAGVSLAVSQLADRYRIEILAASAQRQYAIGVRR